MTQITDDSDIVARLEAAVLELTEAGIARLCKQAAYLAIGTPDGNVMTLFNEAFLRTLNGSREWNPKLPFNVYIFGAMRSIAYAEKNLAHRKTEKVEADFYSADEGDESFLSTINGSPGTDEVLIARNREIALQSDFDALCSHFKGDENVELVFAALQDGTPRHVLIEDFGMTVTQYESARKKLRRGADVIFRGRRKS